MFKKYRKTIWVVLGFLLITAPGAIVNWLSLIEKFRGSEASMNINLSSWRDFYIMIFPIAGLAVILFGLWWTKPTRAANNGVKESKKGRSPIEKAQGRDEVEKHIIDADNAISARNVNMWLDCHINESFNNGWYGLQRDTKPFFIVSLNVSSRFLYDLSFTNAEHIRFSVQIDVDQNPETVSLEAMLIETQSNWGNVDEIPRVSTAVSHIQSLKVNELYFRLEPGDDVRNKIIEFNESHQYPRLRIMPDWTLETKPGKKVSYSMGGIILDLKPILKLLTSIRNQRESRKRIT